MSDFGFLGLWIPVYVFSSGGAGFRFIVSFFLGFHVEDSAPHSLCGYDAFHFYVLGVACLCSVKEFIFNEGGKVLVKLLACCLYIFVLEG